MTLQIGEIVRLGRKVYGAHHVHMIHQELHSAECRLDEARGEVEFQELRVSELRRDLQQAKSRATAIPVTRDSADISDTQSHPISD